MKKRSTSEDQDGNRRLATKMRRKKTANLDNMFEISLKKKCIVLHFQVEFGPFKMNVFLKSIERTINRPHLNIIQVQFARKTRHLISKTSNEC